MKPMAYNQLLQDICRYDLRKYLKINTNYARYSRIISMYVPVSTCMKIFLFIRPGRIFVLPKYAVLVNSKCFLKTQSERYLCQS